MTHRTDPSDEELERLLSGQPPQGDGLDDLASLVADVRSAYLVAATAVEDRHVLPIVAEAELATSPAAGWARSARRAHRSAIRAGGLPVWRRRTLAGSVFASLGMKVAGVAVAATAAAGGLAATGNLPDAAQTAVADVVEHVGVLIPNPGNAPENRSQDAGRPEEPGKSVSDDVEAVLDEPYESGADKGAAVSESASQNRQDDEHAQGGPSEAAGVPPTSPGGNPNGYGNDGHPDGNRNQGHPAGSPRGFEFDH